MAERTSDEPVPEVDEQRYRRRVRRSTVAIIAVVLLAGAAFAGRAAFAAHARSQVDISLGPARLTCADLPDGSPGTTPGGAAVIGAGMECRLPVRITNHGRSPVALGDLRLPGVGPGTGGAVRATGLDPNPHPERLASGPANGGAQPPEALFALDRTLAPGETLRFDVIFHHNADGCAPQGWRLGLARSPQVEVRSLGLGGTRTVRGEPVPFWSATDVNDC